VLTTTAEVGVVAGLDVRLGLERAVADHAPVVDRDLVAAGRDDPLEQQGTRSARGRGCARAVGAEPFVGRGALRRLVVVSRWWVEDDDVPDLGVADGSVGHNGSALVGRCHRIARQPHRSDR
jgi:hypothetical protein